MPHSRSRTLFPPKATAKSCKEQHRSANVAAVQYSCYKSFLNTVKDFSTALNRWLVTYSDFVQIQGLQNPGCCPITKWSPTRVVQSLLPANFLSLLSPSPPQFPDYLNLISLLAILNFLQVFN